jgi:hypothetical protein
MLVAKKTRVIWRRGHHVRTARKPMKLLAAGLKPLKSYSALTRDASIQTTTFRIGQNEQSKSGSKRLFRF